MIDADRRTFRKKLRDRLPHQLRYLNYELGAGWGKHEDGQQLFISFPRDDGKKIGFSFSSNVTYKELAAMIVLLY